MPGQEPQRNLGLEQALNFRTSHQKPEAHQIRRAQELYKETLCQQEPKLAKKTHMITKAYLEIQTIHH